MRDPNAYQDITLLEAAQNLYDMRTGILFGDKEVDWDEPQLLVARHHMFLALAAMGTAESHLKLSKHYLDQEDNG